MIDRPTIFALASPPGRGAIAVLRISGRLAGAALEALTGAPLPPPRRARLVRLRDPSDESETLDRAIVLWFEGPTSYTGEDMAELHLHGGRAVVAGVVDALARLPGLRPAEPGEFTRRAFLNGKLDLTESEAVADLVAAETEAQRRQALRQLEGELGRTVENWRSRLLRALAHVEAEIDFVDEEDVRTLTGAALREARAVGSEIRALLDDRRRGERLREGLEVAILGPPNAGKSSLLNALARRDAAIVSARAGTTRDVIEVRLDLGGYPLILADTAGLREAGDEIESEGVRRALERAARADLKLVVVEAWDFPAIGGATRGLLDADSILVVNKIDLCPAKTESILAPNRATDLGVEKIVAASARTGEGLAVLVSALEAAIAERLGRGTEGPAITRARHRVALEECAAAIERAQRAAGEDLAAEDLRLALRALGRITGRVGVEDLLDVIFRDFCIGK